MLSIRDEIIILLKGLDTLEKQDLTNAEVLDRWMTLHACLRQLLWKEYGQRERDQ